jgi:hypothetical protein
MSTEADSFKCCSLCGHCWASRARFLDDPSISIVGYQAYTEEVSRGILLFNHGCGTTLALGVTEFQDLYDGVIYSERLAGTPRCPQRCFNAKDLEPCPNPCAGAWVRELIQRIKRWPKRRTPEAAPVSSEL